MTRTAILATLALLALSALALPAQAADPLPLPHVEGTCVVGEHPDDYRVCVRTDNNCPRVTYRGFFGQGSIPYCS